MTLNQTTQYSCQKSLRFHVHIRKKDAKAFKQNQVLTICKQNTYLLFIHLLVHFDSVMLKSGDIGVIFWLNHELLNPRLKYYTIFSPGV